MVPGLVVSPVKRLEQSGATEERSRARVHLHTGYLLPLHSPRIITDIEPGVQNPLQEITHGEKGIRTSLETDCYYTLLTE